MRRLVRLCLGVLLVALWSVPLSAQSTGTIRGTVTDAGTQTPIGGASVAIGARLAVTQPDGTYRITGVPAGTDTLRARMIGAKLVEELS